jgi:hypothetical protein
MSRRAAPRFRRLKIEACAVVIIGAVATVCAYVAYGMGIWRDGLPDAGMYPALAAGICAVLCLIEASRLALTDARSELPAATADDEPPEWSLAGIEWRKLAFYGIGFAVQLLTFLPLGFFISSAITTLLILTLGERWPLLKSFITTVGLLAAAYVLFVLLLGIRFPAPAVLDLWSS